MGAFASNEYCSHSVYQISMHHVESFPFVITIWMLFWWGLHKILVHKFKMYPTIFTTSSVLQQAEQITTSNLPVPTSMDQSNMSDSDKNNRHSQISQVQDKIKLILTLSKRLDNNNTFRMRTRGSIYVVKTVCSFIMFLTYLFMLYDHPSFYVDYFWYFRKCAANYIYLRYFMIPPLTLYSWEIVFIEQNFYNHWSTYLHHWLTIIFCATMMAGLYSPFLVQHGLLTVALDGFVNFSRAFRYSYCEKYPELTNILVTISCCIYIFLAVLCALIDILLFTRLFMIGLDSNTFSILSTIISVVAIFGFSFAEYALCKSLYQWKSENYKQLIFPQ